MHTNRAMPHLLLQSAPWTEGCKKVIPGARVCSVLTQKGTAWAGLLLGPLDISTIAGQCMVGCLRMIMVHIIGGLSVGVLEDAREIAHSHTGQAILSDMHPYAMKPMIRRLVGAEICIQALRFSATKSFKGTRESPENCWLCESMVAGAQMSTQQTTTTILHENYQNSHHHLGVARRPVVFAAKNMFTP